MRFKVLSVLVIIMLLLGACQSAAPAESTEAEVQTSSASSSLSTTLESASSEISPLASPIASSSTIPLNSPVLPPVEATTGAEQNPSTVTPLLSRAVGTPGQNEPPDMVGNTAVIFRQSGGIAGIDKQWTIGLNGQITDNSGQNSQVKPEQVQQLLKEIEMHGFFELNDSYVPRNTCCDRFTYVITVHLDGRTKTVSTIDASPTQPGQLTEVLIAINKLLSASQ